MKKFNKFYFEKFRFNENTLRASFCYSFDWIVNFEEVINFKSEYFRINNWIDFKDINVLLFNLHISLGISYYKLFPTKKLIIKSGFLDNIQIKFWKKFYLNWLWEFFYKNNIDFKDLIIFENFVCWSLIFPSIERNSSETIKNLVPIWWWKDSIVTIELLNKSNIDFDLFVFWKIDNFKRDCAWIAWKKILLIERKLSNNLFKLNKEGYYNWHVPISWIISFVSLLVAHLYWYKNIIFSNEKSSNYWNTNWNWIEINHQYSKSYEFEKDFNFYVKKYISDDLNYYSLLRWLYEIKIADIFANIWKKYFKIFSSCNWNFKINSFSSWEIVWRQNRWCNNCPKCLFVFSILYPYLNNLEIKEIFWKDLYYDNSLLEMFKDLIVKDWVKPFECVWTKEEVILAMKKSIINFWNKKNPIILEIIGNEIINKLNWEYFQEIENKFLKIYDEDIIKMLV